MYIANEILSEVSGYVNNLTYDREPQSLYEPIKYVLSLGGRRIRPTPMLLSYNLFRDNPETILSPAYALETYHNYTLLHDDLMGDALLRHGQQTVHIHWDANMTILSGDSMLILASERMAQYDSRHLSEVLRLFTVTALGTGEGQQYGMEFESHNDVKEEEYIEIIRLKAGALLVCAMKIGAILVNAPAEDVENLYKFGGQIGLAFQLQDDYLDVYGDPKVFSRKIGDDIICDKKTYVSINAFNKANARQCKELEKWIGCENFNHEEKVAAITELYNSIGVDKMTTECINYYLDGANKYIIAINLPDERKAELLAYAQGILHRKR